MRKISILLGIVIFLCLLLNSNSVSHSSLKFSLIDKTNEPVILLFAGDVMLSRAIGKIMTREGFDFPYAKIGTLITSADISFANLETPVSNRGTNVGSKYSFRTEPEAIPALAQSGFDVMSIANNHIWDWGKDAFLDTITILDQNNIKHIGGGVDFNTAHSPVLIERNGIIFAYLGYSKLVPTFLQASTSVPSVAYPSVENIQNDIANARNLGAEVIVVSFHWGTEYETEHDAEQERLAHVAIDAGALIVVGHHPHVGQEIEKYKDGLIVYSLGNFIFDQNFSEDTRKGLVVEVVIEDGKIKSYKPIEIKFTKDYQPFVANSQ